MKRLLLSVRNLKTHFPLAKTIVKAVDGISFDLFEGETLCVVGESGSGKSAAARSILQILDRPGKIVDGEILLHRYREDDTTPSAIIDIAKLGRSSRAMQMVRRQDISMIFQEPMSSLSLAHSCGDQIVEAILLRHPRMAKRDAWQRAVELLRQMQLPDPALTASQYPFQLSGGMRQRAMIAMALASEPRILIADEPTTALDVTTQAEILALLERLRSSLGLGVIFITHDVGVVANIADRVAVMQLGKVVETGDLRSIFDHPQHPYTRMLLASAQRLEKPSPLRATVVPVESTHANVRPILKVRDLGKTFVLRRGLLGNGLKELRAVDGVSFDVMPRENVGIVGESGSGKSTMARCIVGLHNASAGSMLYRDASDGEVELAGRVRKGNDPLLREVRMIFQDPFSALNPRMTVGQIIGEPIRLAKTARGRELKERVAELLSLVGLEPRMMERYPHAFSGGQRQRIVIARAIATSPRLIVADEATSALDVSLRAQMLDLMLELQNRLNLSYVFITHDISNIRYFCDRVVVMHQGKVVETGTVDAVLNAPSHDYTKRLIASVPRPDPSLQTPQ
ncbi:MAG: ABC transporter ATP-binding protein [Devosia sp.]|uniref:dipeptide ABC transporter ATP-binding protein n=1 Tax=Devosia sp. 66-22 TaxID=1895753 RepID=UPI000929C3B0|nr:ABC transporter ATP-binding protein [Devosia sp. 66-22]MBN9347916.1 ABC transporter ATP-binding protein [Devosia sp.]OJX50067.1 MAG: ABC transporter ATP-binding protein [Devosia sp. 66-22]